MTSGTTTMQLALLYFSICSLAIYASFPCDDIAELGQPYTISTYTEYSQFIWMRPDDYDRSILACDTDSCISTEPGYVGNSTNNSTSLKIRKVTVEDNGLWKLLETMAPERIDDVCHLIIMQKPMCTINSLPDGTDLDLDEVVEMNVTLRNAYCSKDGNVTLTTGKDNMTLLENVTQTDVEDIFLNKTFSMSTPRFGRLKVFFSCGDKTYDLGCGGTQKLIKSRPECNIHSNETTNDLDLNENVTLMVDIRGYLCPEVAEFTLLTGQLSDLFEPQLDGRDDVTNVTLNLSFPVTQSRLGRVGVNYTCDDDTWPLNCSGITELVQRTTTTSTTTTTTSTTTTHVVSTSTENGHQTELPTSIPATVAGEASMSDLPWSIIIGASVGGVCVIVIIIVIIVNRRKLKRVAQKYIVHRTVRRRKPPYYSDLDLDLDLPYSVSRESTKNVVELEKVGSDSEEIKEGDKPPLKEGDKPPIKEE